jgi:thiosulfate/3-mercaptopyruvate sulfurtransferase
VFGHKSVFVLDGGLPAWQRAGGILETSPPKKYSAATYPVPAKNEDLVRSFEEMSDLAKRNDKRVQILDARSSGRSAHALLLYAADHRFHGTDPEPREGGSI